MIYIGNNEISNIYIGTDKIYGIYVGDLQIYPTDINILTAISLENLVWVTNIPASGGTATKENCTYSVIAYYSDGTTVDVTSEATITGSQVIPSTDIEEVHSAGTLTLTASYSGFTATGSVDVYQEAAVLDFSKKPLTFNILSGGTIVWKASESDSSVSKTIEYKLNNGAWVSITSNAGSSAPTITVNSGDKIQFRGNNAQYANSVSFFNSFGGSALFEAEGNIMSLIYGDDFKNKLTISSEFAFNGLFRDCANLVSAENLILPATTLADWCYGNMFQDCSSLTTAPELPATTLASYCCYEMFYNCSKLTTAPELPATNLADNCYSNMFQNCSSLETASSILPAITLAENCYSYMFYGCGSLTSAPELPANTLVDGCYQGMFVDCSSLNYIKCLATDISAYGCTSYWVYGVAPTGTFVKNPDMNDWTEDEQGIPVGWDIEDA